MSANEALRVKKVNKSMSQQDQIQDGTNTRSLADLPLTAEQADQTKAGAALIGKGTKVTIDFCETH